MTETPTTVETCAPAEARAIGLDVATTVANTLKALADPLRLRMLSAIAWFTMEDYSKPTPCSMRQTLRNSRPSTTWRHFIIRLP